MAMRQASQQTLSDPTDTSEIPVESAGPLDVPVEEARTPHANGVGANEMPAGKRTNRFLVIRVSQGGDSKANIRIPLGLARAAMKFIPRAEKENLKEQGIDVEAVLAGLTSDEEGMLVQVEADDATSVWIGVE